MKTAETKDPCRGVVWSLLRRNISPGQIIGYALANLVGLAIVLSAIQFYRDTAVGSEDDTFIAKDYYIVSKKIEGVSFTPSNNAFTAEELEEIESQPWVKSVGRFHSARFGVRAGVNFQGHLLSTDMFLEAIPDEFYDVKPRDWDSFDPSDPEAEIPVVVARDYLALYNFGFAASRGMPQVSESTVSAVPLRFNFQGNGKNEIFNGRIVGFSSRLNTIAVPESVLDWANDRYAPGVPQGSPSRVILEISNPADPAVADFFNSRGYVVAGDKIDSGKASLFLAVVTGAVITVGAIISILAFFILLLSIYLLLQKNRQKIRDLILLGYTPGAVARYYNIIVLSVNAAVLILAVVAAWLGSKLWRAPLESVEIHEASMLPTILIGVAIIAVISVINLVAIRRNVRSVA